MTQPPNFQDALQRIADGFPLPGPVVALRRLSGGASQETWSFDVGGEGYILRRAPGGVQVEGSRHTLGLANEALVIRAARAAGAAAPEIVHVCAPSDGLGAAYIMRRIAGETIARKILRDPEFAEVRPQLAYQCGGLLARIHAVRTADLPQLAVADACAQLDQYEEIYRSFDDPRPTFELALRLLRARVPKDRPLVLVHGDFRNGNLMIGPDGVRAALDWEIAHLGDPAEDLGWICTPSWRFGEVVHPVGGFGALEDLLKGYRDGGGRDVGAQDVRYWTMLGALKWGIMCLLMYRAFQSGADPSVERAAIGRRASETEMDLVLMMEGRL
jgi:aminoglycoside phosphotransferase (APT) family kinase protein